MKLLSKIILVIMVFTIVIFLIGKGIADAKGRNSGLYGDYSFSLILNCASGPDKFWFTPELLRPIPGNSYTVVIQGILSFNRDGTGSSSHHALGIIHTATGDGQYPVSENECNAVLSYTMNENATYAVKMATTCKRIAGSQTGRVFTIEDIVRKIRAGHGHHTLLISDTKPNIENVTFLIDTTSTALVEDEPATLSDFTITFLENSDVLLDSVIVTQRESFNGFGIEYKEGIDYEIEEFGQLTRIARKPGGSIINGQTIFVRYRYPPFLNEETKERICSTGGTAIKIRKDYDNVDD